VRVVGEPDLRRLVGDQLGGIAGAFAGGDRDVESGLTIEALVMRDEETEVWTLIDPIKRHVHRLQWTGGARPP